MGKKLITFDDLTGEHGATEIEFSIRGVQFSIDVVEENAKQFYADLAKWVEAATLISGTRVFIPDEIKALMAPEEIPSKSGRGGEKHSPEDLAQCKIWCEALGVAWNTGRQPDDIWDSFYARDPTKLRKGRITENPLVRAQAEVLSIEEGVK